MNNLGERLFSTFCDRDCGAESFLHGYDWNDVVSTAGMPRRGIRCVPSCYLGANPSCGLVVRVTGRFSGDEGARLACFSRVEHCHDVGLQLGDVVHPDILQVCGNPRTTRAPSNVRVFLCPLSILILAQTSWTECFFHVLQTSMAPQTPPGDSIGLYMFKAYIVAIDPRDEVFRIVGCAQSHPFELALRHTLVAVAAPAISSPPPAAAAVDLHFVACGCPALFTSSYVRMNKSGGRKELRCFPHCCPQHMPRNSCNVPVRIGVHAPSITHLRLLARVEAEHVQFRAGDVVESADLLLDDDENWIAGTVIERQDALLATYGFQAMQSLGGRDVVMGWPYLWTSSASKECRDQLHKWTAYALTAVPGRQDMLHIEGVLSSPPFQLKSYRRADSKGSVSSQ
ncbi:Aste57867_564 [Aphanomyces stellatus]|uniref:Aste57867_564 protein n=1 Tax=Aphanomyces stellatus TaxID=120398 RepID=A0A485K717_9STRA|nr:hypothetical protein As57867_000563 [Aphanomyces stellatus]VFT77789.1 Aste57867_564 [Aphanomyces stellatus]